MKMTKHTTLTRMLGGLAAASVCLGFAGTASAQSEFNLDLGLADSSQNVSQDVEPGFTEWSIKADASDDSTPWTIGARTFSVDWGNGGSFNPGADEIRMFIKDTAGGAGNMDARNRSDVSGTLGDMTEDFWKADGGNTEAIQFTFQGVEQGTYTMEVFANNSDAASGENYAVEVTDVNGTRNAVGTITDSAASDFDSLQFTFESNGTDDVNVFVNGDPGVKQPIANGFTIVPEPQTYALIGGLLALGAVMLRRRRS